ncbi:carboxymuconolactone decarboxylase family protein [Fluoribacter dumoffii]|uniref:Alkyl hydroperoxide reductase AhpD n=1 Tax=Fluoribacter dumoffii TaxID=463 RepID=A0A377GE34_9GAMM|nr:carboxymuconolactone decarboxylase family protein [Fluoribacter dumoffii]KTC91015.1 alkyl hydroperoxide reductase [Fluoribacter dumoffii NY 23]MCW8386584.1 carboxymuconolactone decarboxylase family protein [Fluoribacter dumoffii]MCW8419638.1 carboxymuconolactone decarboxylase family protein [Fluoribacter dumoffii]MCW8455659.1 carboxymuconolactone decarboxylase family protein [Fluoribacter dumoffii]MCW8460262.1 carboxymuconolactone decarboxylase family protein [Fluoribacter dumoffii]
MSIEQLKQEIPDFAKDIRLNVSNLFGNISQSGLTETQFYGVALAVAYTVRSQPMIDAIKTEGANYITADLENAVKTAAVLMAMNNIYYRAIHLAENKELASLPANLRMNGMLNPGVPKADFELFALAVSAINGCGMCIHSHVRQLLEHELDKVAVQSVLRIAATLNALAFALAQKEV